MPSGKKRKRHKMFPTNVKVLRKNEQKEVDTFDFLVLLYFYS